MEKILRIEEETFKTHKNDYQSYDGFLIVTDKQTIKIGISNSQSCCESWGYFMSEDDLSLFENSVLTEISITDTALNTESFNKRIEDEYLDCGGCMFVNFETSKGKLQFVAYNAHNGYYGHDAVIISEQLKKEECL